ncbi:MAG: response regulator [Candidatus Sumerlaeia bacterium]|nr:response regulator [Candidatus Sumerlaeia bacterium]
MTRILVVDDEPLIRGSLCEYLQDDYDVESAASGPEALGMLEQRPADLIISDINMKPMNGIELLVEAHRRWPETRRALITGYDVDDYIRLIKRHRITNVITKATPFDFQEFVNTVKNILEPSRVFGLDRHLGADATLRRRRLRTHEEKDAMTEEMVSALHPLIEVPRRAFELRLVFEEIVNNSFFHAFRNADGTPVHSKDRQDDLAEHEEVTVEYGHDAEQVGFSVTDSAGSLSVDRFLEKIERQVTQDGLMDEDGRGLFLARAFSSRLIVNIEPSRRTQIIVLFHRHRDPAHKPLYLNLVD